MRPSTGVFRGTKCQIFWGTKVIMVNIGNKILILGNMATNELPPDKTNKMACAPSEDSDQPGHPPCLIRVFAVRKKEAWVLGYPLSAQRRLWSDWVCPGWSESLLCAHAILLVLSWGGSNLFQENRGTQVSHYKGLCYGYSKSPFSA